MLFCFAGLADHILVLDNLENSVLINVESEQEIQTEASTTFTENCKLGIFLTVCLSIVIYIGLCLRAVYTTPFYYPARSCEK